MSSGGTQSVHRAISILRDINLAGSDGIRIKDLEAIHDLPRPTIIRLLQSLIAEGLAEKDESSGRYHLGPLTFELGLAAGARFALNDIAGLITREVAASTGDTIFLSVRSGAESVCVSRTEGPYPIRALTMEPGSRRPLGAGAGSLALLSQLPDAEVERIIAYNRARYVDYKGIDPQVIKAAVSKTRNDGYALLGGIIIPEVTAIGTSIGEPFRGLNVAISLVGLRSRVEEARLDDLVRTLRKAAGELEKIFKSYNLGDRKDG